MTGNEDLYETLMRELDDVVVCDSGEIQQQHEDFLFNEETVSDDFPPSLLSYFETSKNRAAVCEKLILEDLEGFTASHQTDDVMIFSTERDKDKLNMQVSCETEKEEINTSSETEKLFIHNVSTSVNSEDEADIDECVGCEEDVKGDDVKMKKNSEYQRNVREKRRCEETEKEEKQRREREFEEELKKLMEAEKRHQEELELMEKKAQEKLEQEFLLQQELISNLQRRVEEEKKMRDEEEERRRKEEERRRQEEEERRRKEERRKEEEEERRRRKEERKKQEEEEERRRKEEERREEGEKKKKEDEEKKRMKEEKKKQKEEEEKKREEEEKQERRMKEEEEKRKEEKKMKEEREKEEERKREEEKKMERKQMEEEMKRKKDDEVKREKEGMRLKEKQKQQEEEEKKEEEETRQTDEEEEMMEVTKRKNVGGTRRKEDESNSDEEVKMKENEEEEKMMKRKEEINIKEDEEKEKKIKEEETRKLEEEKMRRQKKEEEIRIKKEKRLDEDEGKIQEEKDDVKRRNTDEEENIRIKTEEETNVNRFTTLQQGDGATVRSESTSNSFISPQSDHHHHLHPHHRQDSESKTTNRPDEEVRPRLPLCLPENTEHKRLTWMKLCTSWSKLSLQNKNKVKTRGGGGGGGGRGGGTRRKVDTLPPLCPNSLLQSTGCKSLQEVTSLTLEDSSSCNLSTLAQCFRLQSLTLRRCGLKSLDNINELQRLCYIDVQENSISSVDCENMKSLRVLRLGHNELRSIHGLNGAEHLDFLDVSHNNITRVAGLESTRRLQTLTVDHNQLISTRGLKDVYTLMHLDCSHNHLVNVEGLENNALLKTLDLRANNLTEPPSLSNHVLLTDLRLDNNSVSSLQGLSSCWLPLMRRLSAAQNRITHLPSMFDFVSLENLDLRFNCLSELQDVCQSLDGCLFLRQLHLVGNPLQQEKGWRSALQKTASGLRLIDGEETDSSPSSAVVQRVDSASGGFITFCQTQLTQTDDLQQQHSDELRKASSRLDEVKICCRHFNETLKLAIDHRFAHEYGEVAVSEGQTTTPDDDDSDPVKTFLTSDFHFFETTPESNLHNLESRKKASSHLDEVKLSVDHENDDVATSEGQTTPSSNHQNLESIKTTAAAAAVLIQQQWRKYRVKCLRNVSRSPPTEEEEGGGETESGPSFINRSHVGQDQAATVIQALWRGFALRRRLASALAAVTSHDDEDETLEEVDVDEFIFDEEELERYCSLQLYDDSTSRRRSVKPLVEPSEHTLPPVHPQEAWPDPPRYKTSTHTFNGRGSSASDLSDVSTRTKQIMDEWGFTDSHTALQLLRRAQKMKPKMKKQPRQKHTNPCVRTDVFRNCSYQRKPAKAPNYSGYKKAVERGRSLRHHETQPIKPRLDDDDSESERFLPEISSDIQNGGRVQLVADPGYTEQLHHSGGSLAKTLAAQTCNQRHRNTRNDLLPSPQRVSSAPNRKERISFRDNAVRFSGGWGGGKKRSNDK